MDTLTPIVNLLTILTVLSFAAERATNLLKLRNEDMATEKVSKKDEKKREHKIAIRSLWVGIFFSLLAKADLMRLMGGLDDPWATLGWGRYTNGRWLLDPSVRGWNGVLFTAAGCVFTGIALGFGSKFWHDVLDGVFELKGIAERAKTQKTTQASATIKTTTVGEEH